VMTRISRHFSTSFFRPVASTVLIFNLSFQAKPADYLKRKGLIKTGGSMHIIQYSMYTVLYKHIVRYAGEHDLEAEFLTNKFIAVV
jgi:hypothetical protein